MKKENHSSSGIASVKYNTRPKKICTECKQEIPYSVSVEGGKKFICPKCKKEIDIMKCIQWDEL